MPQDVRQAGRNHPKSLGNEDISDGSRLTGGRRVVDVEQRIAGDVTVSVTVDRAGKVTGARVTEGGDDCMRESALRAARNSLFNIDDSAPARQTGTITYIFIPQ